MPPTTFKNCADRDRLLAQARYHKTGPVYFLVPSSDGNLMYIGKHGLGAIGQALHTHTVPSDVLEKLG